MNYNSQAITSTFKKLLKEQKPYIYWKEMPKTKIWYEPSDNTFKTDIGISNDFGRYITGYLEDDIDECLTDLYHKIVDTYNKKGIVLHVAYPHYDDYETTHK